MDGIETPRVSAESITGWFEALTKVFRRRNLFLYEHLCAQAPTDSNVMELACRGLAAAPVIQLLAGVHYLLMEDPTDPLARFYPPLTKVPASPEDGFPEFARFCRQRRVDLLEILETRPVQMTLVERCGQLLGPISYVARLAGEPLNLIEIGCSAGVLLTFDKYAYDLKGCGRLGDVDAPLTLSFEVHGGPELHIPKVDQRIGVDLSPVDVRSDDERRWLLAFNFPEWREEQARLATALDVVATSDITMLKGDALDLLPQLIAKTPGPLCIYHSNCVIYWPEEAKAGLESLLVEGSRGREIFRIGIETPANWSPESSTATSEIVVARYRDGCVDSKVVASSDVDTFAVTWVA